MKICLLLLFVFCLPLHASRITTEPFGDKTRLLLESESFNTEIFYDFDSRSGCLSRLSFTLGGLSYGANGWEGRSSLSSFDCWVLKTRWGSALFSSPFPDPLMPYVAGYRTSFSHLSLEVDAFAIPSHNQKRAQTVLYRRSVEEKGGGLFRLTFSSGILSSVLEIVGTQLVGVTGYVDTKVDFGKWELGASYGSERWPLSYYLRLDDSVIKFRFARRYGPQPLYYGKAREEIRSYTVVCSDLFWGFRVNAYKRNKASARISATVTLSSFSFRGSFAKGKMLGWALSWQSAHVRLSYGSSGISCTLTWEKEGWQWHLNFRSGRNLGIRVSYSW